MSASQREARARAEGAAHVPGEGSVGDKVRKTEFWLVISPEWQPGSPYRLYTTMKGLRRAIEDKLDPIFYTDNFDVWHIDLHGSNERITAASLADQPALKGAP